MGKSTKKGGLVPEWGRKRMAKKRVELFHLARGEGGEGKGEIPKSILLGKCGGGGVLFNSEGKGRALSFRPIKLAVRKGGPAFAPPSGGKDTVFR